VTYEAVLLCSSSSCCSSSLTKSISTLLLSASSRMALVACSATTITWSCIVFSKTVYRTCVSRFLPKFKIRRPLYLCPNPLPPSPNPPTTSSSPSPILRSPTLGLIPLPAHPIPTRYLHPTQSLVSIPTPYSQRPRRQHSTQAPSSPSDEQPSASGSWCTSQAVTSARTVVWSMWTVRGSM
jgi:hypothetical protein